MKDLSLIDKMDTPFPEEESRAIFKVKDIKQLDKYFKWIKYGRPIDAVKMKLADETDLDPDLLDDPEAEAPPELVPIAFQGKDLFDRSNNPSHLILYPDVLDCCEINLLEILPFFISRSFSRHTNS